MLETPSDTKSATKPPEHKSFWATLPGLLTAVGGIVAAIGTLITALVAAGVLGANKPTPTVVPTATPVAAVTAPSTPAPVATAGVVPSPTPAPPATQSAPTATPSPAGVLFEDDFSAQRNDWLTEVSPEVEKGYEGGEFRISVYQRNFSSWTFPHPSRDLADFAVEVDARWVSGPLDNEYGLLTRYQDASDEFYLFAISSDGFYTIEKYQGGQWHDLVKWTEAEAVKQGEAVNRLRVICQGSTLRFFANGELLAQAEDASFHAGNIGLLASSGEKEGVTIAFDNLRVRALTGP
ncbi:MAG: hypothetical protein NT169_22350 [Chloroflexi bacterium]|nr:hypothetical protein [Chloroflexota bacterium]